MADKQKEELSEAEKIKLNRLTMTDVTMIALEHGVKVEDLSKHTLNLFIALYIGGMAAGLKAAKELLKENPKDIDPEDIPF